MPRGHAAGEVLARKYTMDLVCGNIGVNAPLPEAIGLARRHGFESVAPDAGFLKSAPEARLSELRHQLEEGKLVWARPGSPSTFAAARRRSTPGSRASPATPSPSVARRHPHGDMDHAHA